jgi:hypothetical protein
MLVKLHVFDKHFEIHGKYLNFRGLYLSQLQ